MDEEQENAILGALLRRILKGYDDRGWVGFDRFPQGDGMVCLDTGWVDLTTEETEVVERVTESGTL